VTLPENRRSTADAMPADRRISGTAVTPDGRPSMDVLDWQWVGALRGIGRSRCSGGPHPTSSIAAPQREGRAAVKPQFKDVEHLLRLAAIFVVGLALFAVVRARMVPSDFGRLGHYRAGALNDVRARPIAYAGQQACAACHEDVVATRASGRHAPLACEGCHGPSAKHADDPGDAHAVKPDGRVLCARCHAANTGKPRWYRTVNVNEHAGDENCVTCHTPHSPRIG
jgi:hypothetical protein